MLALLTLLSVIFALFYFQPTFHSKTLFGDSTQEHWTKENEFSTPGSTPPPPTPSLPEEIYPTHFAVDAAGHTPFLAPALSLSSEEPFVQQIRLPWPARQRRNTIITEETSPSNYGELLQRPSSPIPGTSTSHQQRQLPPTVINRIRPPTAVDALLSPQHHL